jgi:predicted Fe-Mo cluster-binding NifX family protein
MKIAVATDDQKTIASHFGRASGFMIYSTGNGEILSREFRPNLFTGHSLGLESQGNAHQSHGPILAALRDCTVVISHGMGRRIYNDLSQSGIEAFIIEENDCEQAARLYLDGKLVNHPELGCDHKHK